jgi:hypothetical protein
MGRGLEEYDEPGFAVDVFGECCNVDLPLVTFVPLPWIFHPAVLKLLLVDDCIALPLFEHARQTLKTVFSTLIFFRTSAVCFPHNSQKETMFI